MKFRKINWLIGVLLVSILISACNIGATPAPTQDPNAIQTQAFEIVLTQQALLQTQTAAAIPPTPLPTNTLAPINTLPPLPTTNAFATSTPFGINTQQPGLTPLAINSSPTVGVISTTTTKNGCNDGYLISEGGPYDGKTVGINTEFTKTWEFINVGTCAWDEGYTFAFVQEFSTGPKPAKKDFVIPKDGPFAKPGGTYTFTVDLKTPKTPGEYIWYFKLKDDAGNFFGSLVWTKIIVVKG
jgi:hypothetical protein